MTALDRLLVAALALAAWILAAHLMLAPAPVAADTGAEPQLTREEIVRIVEDWLNDDSPTGGRDVVELIIEDCLGSIDAQVKVRMLCS